jgi:hypothetical protein
MLVEKLNQIGVDGQALGLENAHIVEFLTYRPGHNLAALLPRGVLDKPAAF